MRGRHSLSAVATGSPGNIRRCCWPSPDAVPLRSADTVIAVPAADRRPPSPTTRAANRHCPKCQGNARHRWLEARQRELLPTRYVHVVFTLPRELAPIALQNKRGDLQPALSLPAPTPCWRSPAIPGTWERTSDSSVCSTPGTSVCSIHPHVHCVVAAGGLAPGHSRWIYSRHSFFLPIPVLSRVFRGKFVAGLKTAFSLGTLQFHGNLAPLREPEPSPPGFDPCSAITGSFTPSDPSADRSTRCAISALTPTASPSPTTDWLLSPGATSPFAGETPLMVASSGS